ncbi:phosphatase PAP2 family protein [Spongiactinospora sp. TRM90649]|uniref:phosphatase PAP2 family protein n=1 Tax=Spongiactinospora sp. TRM90649 TaxID=3031114 RepID=UPI0023F9CB00|nr:phosphatase PAP2 family protein [Spongiactinospora sp. TRM90649]MDF5755647.1 phosphatase PAP2 family protein [Spongiactinospora sp. TRM90649]
MSTREAAPGRLACLGARVRSVVSAGRREGRPAPLVEIVLLLVVVLLFTRLHGAATGEAAVATANARVLQSIERALRIDIALGANRWLTEHPVFIQPVVLYYRLYYFVVLCVLVWIFIRRAGAYVRVRRTLVAMSFLVLPVFFALPMSPPRFALPGVVDIIAEHDILGGHAARGIESGQNVYSAMPSMHTAWSLWCAYAVWSAFRPTHPRAAWLAWLFPLGMAAVVLLSGNHYVLDIAGSITLLTVAIALTAAYSHLSRTGLRRG